MSFDLQLKGKRALVTGGTKGLGAALVKSLQDVGVQVMTTARSAPEMPLEGVTYVLADLTTAEGVAKLARAITERWGGVDILINSLGGSSAPGGGFAALSDAVWFDELNLNLLSAVRLDRALLPAMLAKRRGRNFACDFDPARASTSGVDYCLRGGEGSSLHLQQVAVEGGHAKGCSRSACLARLD